MEDLNAQQIVLLTLLVSFVTSIATGITTVSLLERAPEPVTQTINRVVEKTIERVVEVDSENQNNGQTIERVVETVIVNAEDLTIEAISNNSDSLVRISSKSGETKTFVALGIIISKEGEVLVDSRNISSATSYVGQFTSGEKDLTVVFREANNPFSVLKIANASEESFSPVKFGDSQTLKLGQSVVVLSGQGGNVVSTGIITSLEKSDVPSNPSDLGSSTNSIITSIETSADASRLLVGSMLLNLRGELIGVKIGVDQTKPTSFMPIKNVKDFISSGFLREE